MLSNIPSSGLPFSHSANQPSGYPDVHTSNHPTIPAGFPGCLLCNEKAAVLYNAGVLCIMGLGIYQGQFQPHGAAKLCFCRYSYLRGKQEESEFSPLRKPGIFFIFRVFLLAHSEQRYRQW